MVWDYRGRMTKAFHYILDRNETEHFWSKDQVKIMIGRRVHYIIMATCADLGIDQDLTLFCVQEYGVRNTAVIYEE